MKLSVNPVEPIPLKDSNLSKSKLITAIKREFNGNSTLFDEEATTEFPSYDGGEDDDINRNLAISIIG